MLLFRSSLVTISPLNVSRSITKSYIKTLAPLNSPKHAIQQFGSDYIDNQKRSARPLSPHLQIYKPQWTWYVSGSHRITGMAMGIVVAAFSIGMMASPYNFGEIIKFFHDLALPGSVTVVLKFIVAFPIVFHALNGLRFTGYDLGFGMSLKTIYATAYGVVGLSVLVAVFLALQKHYIKE